MSLFSFSANSEADQAARVAIFNKIAPASNWKLRIHATIAKGDFAECNEAAVWFTGGGLEVVEDYGDGTIRVQGGGYYHHIGA